MKYEIKVTSYNWEEKREHSYIATDYSFDNDEDLRIIIEGKKRPRILRNWCYEEVVISELTSGRRILTLKGTDTPKHK